MGGGGGLWKLWVNAKRFPRFPQPGAGGKGEVTFSLSRPKAALFGSPFPPIPSADDSPP